MPISQMADKLFMALGQTLYTCQLFEATMLEVLAHARELLDGWGDGSRFQESIDTLSRRTLGQLLHEFRNRAELRPDIEVQLSAGLDARNFIVHHFAAHVGDDLTEGSKVLVHQRTIYEKCTVVMAANDMGLALLGAIAKMNVTKSLELAGELEQKAVALRELAAK